jgi:hypothetical protein
MAAQEHALVIDDAERHGAACFFEKSEVSFETLALEVEARSKKMVRIWNWGSKSDSGLVKI